MCSEKPYDVIINILKYNITLIIFLTKISFLNHKIKVLPLIRKSFHFLKINAILHIIQNKNPHISLF